MKTTYSDNEIILILIEQIKLRLAEVPFISGFGPIGVMQKPQPKMAGAPTSPTVFVEKLFDDRYGWSSLLYSTGKFSILPFGFDVFHGNFALSNFWPTAVTKDEFPLVNIDPANELLETEFQIYQTTFQISTLVTQNAGSINIPTASDLCTIAANCLQSRPTIRKFSSLSIGLLRVSEVRNPYFSDEQFRHAAMPSFDVVLEYSRVTSKSKVNKIRSVVPSIF